MLTWPSVKPNWLVAATVVRQLNTSIIIKLNLKYFNIKLPAWVLTHKTQHFNCIDIFTRPQLNVRLTCHPSLSLLRVIKCLSSDSPWQSPWQSQGPADLVTLDMISCNTSRLRPASDPLTAWFGLLEKHSKILSAQESDWSSSVGPPVDIWNSTRNLNQVVCFEPSLSASGDKIWHSVQTEFKYRFNEN